MTELTPDKLRWYCDPKSFTFRCTDELVPLQDFIGQVRAISAIEFGLGVDQSGYNIFVTGLSGTGKSTIIKQHVENLVAKRIAEGKNEPPPDWCYLYNFDDVDKPRIVSLPAGKGRELKSQLEQLQLNLRKQATSAFASEDYQNQRRAVVEQSQTIQRKLFQDLDKAARAKGFAVQFTPAGVAIVPEQKDGKPFNEQEFAQLPEATKRKFEELRQSLAGVLQQTVEAAQEAERDAAQKLTQLDRKVAEFSMAGSFKELERRYASNPKIADFLQRLHDFTLKHVDAIHSQEAEQAEPIPEKGAAAQAIREHDAALPFIVNVFVDNADAKGPPIITEGNPTFSNLFGRVDRKFLVGAYVTDHTQIKPGAFHLANGGYLVLNMRRMLNSQLVWETFKRVIKSRELAPEDLAEAMGNTTPQPLRPEPMPLDVKVIVTGDAMLYHNLAAYDEEFWETFKVRADFDYEIPRTLNNMDGLAAFVCGACTRLKLMHFDSTGVAKVVEFASRLVDDQTKLSTRFGLIQDLLIESDYWARKEKAAMVSSAHVRKALAEKVFRSDLVAQRIRESIQEGTILVNVDGVEIGQVNGLSITDVGDIMFGRPNRITAKTFLGRGGVISIDREAKMSGRTFDKGLMIISGYLGGLYAQQHPISVSATLSFEQSYSGIDGDSASSTEIYAILSSLSAVPIKQSIAVTGSVNQKGEIQPIGGVNEKIEGYYDVCKSMGLTGAQGVMIPKQNVRNLMLREDIVEAVKTGQFHIYSVGTIAEGIQVLTGKPAGERDTGGTFPEGSINSLVQKRLDTFALAARAAFQWGGGSADNPKS